MKRPKKIIISSVIEFYIFFFGLRSTNSNMELYLYVWEKFHKTNFSALYNSHILAWNILALYIYKNGRMDFPKIRTVKPSIALAFDRFSLWSL